MFLSLSLSFTAKAEAAYLHLQHLQPGQGGGGWRGACSLLGTACGRETPGGCKDVGRDALACTCVCTPCCLVLPSGAMATSSFSPAEYVGELCWSHFCPPTTHPYLTQVASSYPSPSPWFTFASQGAKLVLHGLCVGSYALVPTALCAGLRGYVELLNSSWSQMLAGSCTIPKWDLGHFAWLYILPPSYAIKAFPSQQPKEASSVIEFLPASPCTPRVP